MSEVAVTSLVAEGGEVVDAVGAFIVVVVEDVDVPWCHHAIVVIVV